MYMETRWHLLWPGSFQQLYVARAYGVGPGVWSGGRRGWKWEMRRIMGSDIKAK